MSVILTEKKVKRKKSKPRFISVQPDGLVQFMKEVGEYKQILRSIGMYDLCQKWKQTRDQQRKEESEVRKQAKLLRKKEKEEMGAIWYGMQEKQKDQERYLEQLVGEQHENETNKKICGSQEKNHAYPNQEDNIEKDKQLRLNETRTINKDDDRNITQKNMESLLIPEKNAINESKEVSLIEKNDLSNQNENNNQQVKLLKNRNSNNSKKMTNLVNNQLRDMQQLRSQEYSEVEELLADQELPYLEIVSENDGNQEMNIQNGQDKSFNSEKNLGVEEKSQFKETDKIYNQQRELQYEELAGGEQIISQKDSSSKQHKRINQNKQQQSQTTQKISKIKERNTNAGMNNSYQSQELQNESERSTLSPPQKINKIKKKKKKNQ